MGTKRKNRAQPGTARLMTSSRCVQMPRDAWPEPKKVTRHESAADADQHGWPSAVLGVGQKYPELLVAAGVDTVRALPQRGEPGYKAGGSRYQQEIDAYRAFRKDRGRQGLTGVSLVPLITLWVQHPAPAERCHPLVPGAGRRAA